MKKLISIILAALMALALVPSASASTAYFSDVPANHWAYQYVQYASQNGLVNGYGRKIISKKNVYSGEGKRGVSGKRIPWRYHERYYRSL